MPEPPVLTDDKPIFDAFVKAGVDSDRPCRTARPLARLGLVAFFTGIGWGTLWLGGHWPPQAWQLAATGTMGLGAGIGSYIAVVMPSDWQRRR